jgi:hypothetical protein
LALAKILPYFSSFSLQHFFARKSCECEKRFLALAKNPSLFLIVSFVVGFDASQNLSSTIFPLQNSAFIWIRQLLYITSFASSCQHFFSSTFRSIGTPLDAT